VNSLNARPADSKIIRPYRYVTVDMAPYILLFLSHIYISSTIGLAGEELQSYLFVAGA